MKVKARFSVLVLAVVAAIVAVVMYSRGGSSPMADDYYASFHSECPLEQRYSQLGPHEVLQLDLPGEDERIGAIRVWYPAELEALDDSWPVVVAVNASGVPASSYEPWFARLASWGFVVVGNEDPQTGTGETASLTLDAIMSLPDGCPIAGKLDEDRMGIVGFSQGGAGALAALTQYENGCLYRAVFTGSAAYPFLAENMGWHYDASLVSVPWLMVAGTGASDDAGVEDPTKEFGGVAPLSSLIEDYDAVDPSLPRVRARAVGAEHEDMLARSDGYMTAWLLWQLCDDGDAAQAFVGADAEIARNPGWQDVEKSV
ncbi:MAG: hypothetical protein IJG82_08580 [Atopobiaceae bacterium]|nr:hypothetical protein [Atopobiaceae bacterium]MBQ6523979.1 hypothetical protein [Atopobiaceae bacterium]